MVLQAPRNDFGLACPEGCALVRIAGTASAADQDLAEETLGCGTDAQSPPAQRSSRPSMRRNSSVTSLPRSSFGRSISSRSAQGFEPTVLRPLSEIQVEGDLVNALIRGDVEP